MSLFISREIDFVKKEEELKKSLDEKDKWYKEQLESLQKRVRPRFWEKIRAYTALQSWNRHWRDPLLFCLQIAVLESGGTSVGECQSGRDSAADERLSFQDSVTNTQSVDSLLGKVWLGFYWHADGSTTLYLDSVICKSFMITNDHLQELRCSVHSVT